MIDYFKRGGLTKHPDFEAKNKCGYSLKQIIEEVGTEDMKKVLIMNK